MGTLPESARAHPGGAIGAHTRELCQSVCSSGTCLTPPTRRNCANIFRVWERRHRSCCRSIVKPAGREASRSSTTPIAASPKKRFADSTSNRSKADPLPSARRVRAKSAGPAARRDLAAFPVHGPAVRLPGPGGPRPGGFAPRPGGFAPRPDAGGARRPAQRNRNFGPDAPPKNKRKPPRKDSDRGPRGPIKERPVGRLYDADEDWRAQDEEVDVDNVATAAKRGRDGRRRHRRKRRRTGRRAAGIAAGNAGRSAEPEFASVSAVLQSHTATQWQSFEMRHAAAAGRSRVATPPRASSGSCGCGRIRLGRLLHSNGTPLHNLMAITARVRATLGVCLTVAAVTLHGCAGALDRRALRHGPARRCGASHPLDGAGAGRRSQLAGQLARERRPTGRRVACDRANRAIRSPRRRQLEHARRRRRHRRPAGRRSPPARRRARRVPAAGGVSRRAGGSGASRSARQLRVDDPVLAARRQPRGNRVGCRAARPARLLRALDAQRRAGGVSRRPRQRHPLDAAADRPHGDRAALRAPAPRGRGGDRCRRHHARGRRGRFASCRHISTTWSARGACGSRAASSAGPARRVGWSRRCRATIRSCSAPISIRGSAFTTAPTAPPRGVPGNARHGSARHLSRDAAARSSLLPPGRGMAGAVCPRRQRLRIRSLPPHRRDPVRLNRYNWRFPMGIPAGTQVGPYQVLSQLGSGGMGEVYRACDPRLSRDVALKVIRRILSVGPDGEDDTLDRLLREAILASALNHPNIVTIYETGVFDTDRYIAMELIEGSTLRQVARQGLAVGRALGIARQVSEALAVAHAAQIVHRDIKPDNVMVRPDGYVKLLDFGLARVQPEMATIGPAGGDDRSGPAARHRRLHGAGTGARRDGHAGSRRLRARRHALRARHRTASVRGAVAARHAARADVGVAGAAVLRQSGAAARDRSADRRDAAEGSAAAARRERGDVSPQPRARFDHRRRAVRGHRHAAAARRRRARSSAAIWSSRRCGTSTSGRSAARAGSW